MKDVVEVSNNYSPGYEDYDEYWGTFKWAGTGLIVNRAEGEFRRMILAKVGKTDGEVLIEENHVDIGYCPSCTYETIHVKITVDGEEVFTRDYSGNPFAEIQDWLTS